ncbi:hypothetical protein [Gymnodinialimonas ulvae]|uniref:hypothetical protein n=1 Tax=Gymnodinialimonas ulvae TaxID=3126504 RepID=UPI00309BDE3D
MGPKQIALATGLAFAAVPTSVVADPARDALACAGFWQANHRYEQQTFLAIDVDDTWASMAQAGAAAATRLGATRAAATVEATARDMAPRLRNFLNGGNRQWFEAISRLCNRVLDREPELAPFR